MNDAGFLRDATIVAGVGQTAFLKRGTATATEFDLCCSAIELAAADAGINPTQIDGFFSFATEKQEPVLLQAALGVQELRQANMVWGGGAGGCSAALLNASTAVATGQCSYAVVYRSICQSAKRFGRFQERPQHQNFTAPFGQSPPIHGVAMVTRRHMHEYGTPIDAFATVAVTARAYANANPRALMVDQPLTFEAHQGSRMIADPLRLFDNCLETDGAAAIVITRADRSPDVERPVYLRGFGHASGPRWSTGPSGANNMPLEDYPTTNSQAAAQQVWRSSGLGPADIDVAQFYDAFTPIPVFHLEEYGFVPRGEGGRFVLAGETGPDGTLPSNTSGGQLSEGYLQGLNLVLEGVRQMRGESTSQVRGARTCLVTSGGAIGHKSALVLRRA